MTFFPQKILGVPLLRHGAVVALVLTMAACGGSGPSGSGGAAVRLSYTGVGALGIFDPAVTLDPANSRVWMGYSAVDPVTNSAQRSPWGVGIRLGYTDNTGTAWVDAGTVSALSEVTVTGPISFEPGEPEIPSGDTRLGIWQSETSTVIYDPNVDVPPGESWKMLYHRVMWANNYPYYVSYSWIEMKQASTAAGLAAAIPVKLFGGSLIKSDATSMTNTAAPISGLPAFTLHTKDGELNNCGLFGEPSLLATSDTLYMALDCQDVSGTSVVPYIVMFKCTSPCNMATYNDANAPNATSWTYLGRVTTPTDAAAINSKYKGLSAPALTTQGGKYYLVTTPVEPVLINNVLENRYDGCRVYEFADLANGLLRRNGMGQLLPPMARVNGFSNTHHGACAHHAALSKGILHSQLEINNPPEIFRIYQSGVNIP